MELPTFAEVVTGRRKALGLSQRRLSAQARLAPSYITRLEAGLRPSLWAFSRVCVALGLSTEEIGILVKLEALRDSPENVTPAV